MIFTHKKKPPVTPAVFVYRLIVKFFNICISVGFALVGDGYVFAVLESGFADISHAVWDSDICQRGAVTESAYADLSHAVGDIDICQRGTVKESAPAD